jgi:hypothetical protein
MIVEGADNLTLGSFLAATAFDLLQQLFATAPFVAVAQKKVFFSLLRVLLGWFGVD